MRSLAGGQQFDSFGRWPRLRLQDGSGAMSNTSMNVSLPETLRRTFWSGSPRAMHPATILASVSALLLMGSAALAAEQHRDRPGPD